MEKGRRATASVVKRLNKDRYAGAFALPAMSSRRMPIRKSGLVEHFHRLRLDAAENQAHVVTFAGRMKEASSADAIRAWQGAVELACELRYRFGP